jgi:hypothetical protein
MVQQPSAAGCHGSCHNNRTARRSGDDPGTGHAACHDAARHNTACHDHSVIG